MPRINLSGVKASDGARKFDIEPGGYVLFVTGVKPNYDREYCFFEWDVAEGADRRFYEDAGFPPRDVLSWKEKAWPMLKHKLSVLSEANPGFNAEAAFYNDDWGAFVGKVFGAVIRKRLYTKNDGTDGEGVEVGRWLSPDEVRAGSFRPMAPRDTRESKPATPARPSRPALADEDIPF